jgi:hypothetical protein
MQAVDMNKRMELESRLQDASTTKTKSKIARHLVDIVHHPGRQPLIGIRKNPKVRSAIENIERVGKMERIFGGEDWEEGAAI